MTRIFDQAPHLVAINVHREGRLEQRGRGSSLVWAAEDFTIVASLRHTSDCNVESMDLITSLDSAMAACDNGFRPGRVYVLSGECRQDKFFVDPCGVRLSLSDM